MSSTLYAIALAVTLFMWFIEIRAPLWLDETVSMFLIKGGWAGIKSRQIWPDAPAYSCLLFLWTKVMGTRELMLRVSSVLPMLAAVYLLYLAARKVFDQDVAIIAAIIFCLHPIIIFAAIDIRPYAFAALAINGTILALVHLRHSNSCWLAALFGLLAAGIVEFQLLFAAILPALAFCFVVAKLDDRKTLWRQLAIALVVFAIAFAPAVPRIQYMMQTSGTHVFAAVPRLIQLISTLTMGGLVTVPVLFVLVAASRRRLNIDRQSDRWTILLGTLLALVPLLILFVLSIGTSMHVFVPRYRLVAVPGIAFCWALVVNWIDSRELRLQFCVTLVFVAAFVCLTSASFHRHMYSWKYALAVAEEIALRDNAAVLICSDIPESDYMKMPTDSAIEPSGILPQLSYYRLKAPVLPLPRAFNEEAVRVGSAYLQEAAKQHRRFLAMAFEPSYKTLDWLANTARATYRVENVGVFDKVRVLEFVPRDQVGDYRPAR